MIQQSLPGNNILVSIIIATYNAEKNIGDCLASIAVQRNMHIEIVIVDGASSDDTVALIKQFSYNNLTWISEPDKGIYDALNKGIKMARGKWLYFLGADDRLRPAFSEMLTHLKEDNTVYYGNCEPFFEGEDPGYTILHGAFSKYRMCKFCINHQSILYPEKIFKKYNYKEAYKVFADWALNMQVWGDNDFKKVFYPITIARYHLKGFSSMHTDEAFEQDKPGLIKKSMGWWLYLRYLFNQYKKKNIVSYC